jgi:hypothetical protein
MREPTAHALLSVQESKKAMIHTIGEVGKRRPRPSKCDFFRASKRKSATASKMRPAADLLRSKHTVLHSVASEVTTASMASAFASLRSEQTEIHNPRGGNDARRKAWKTQTPSFPPFPPLLEIRHNPPDSHIPTASTAALSLFLQRAPPYPDQPFVDDCGPHRS